MKLSNPFDAGVEPWQMLGYLQGKLEAAGQLTPEMWEEAIASQTGRAVGSASPE